MNTDLTCARGGLEQGWRTASHQQAARTAHKLLEMALPSRRFICPVALWSSMESACTGVQRPNLAIAASHVRHAALIPWC